MHDKPTFVYAGSCLGQIFHARIRITLNSDLFRKNIVNSSRCTCGAIETPTHYLLTILYLENVTYIPLTYLFPFPLNFYL